MRVPVQILPGIFSDNTSFGTGNRWEDGSNVRFYLGGAQVIGGCERVTSTLLSGVCRTAFTWTDNSGVLTLGFGTHSHLQIWQGGEVFDITPTLAMPAATLGANPLAVTSGSAVVTVSHPEHGLSTGDTINVSGATALGGITPNIDGVAVTVTNANTYTFTFSSSASSTAPSGGGSAVVITPQVAFNAGQVDGTGSVGFGTGAYGVGGYGEPSDAEYFPRTWSEAAFGQTLIASPRDGTIFQWSNDTASRAQPLTDAPRQVRKMLVAPQDMIFALGCNQEASGVYNPMCIRHSGIRRPTEWKTLTPGDSTAREYILKGGGEIVGGAFIGDFLLIWTNSGLHMGRYVGEIGQVWRFEQIAQNCGLIGPNAIVVVGQRAFWISPDRQFYVYQLGGEPVPLVCPIRRDFAENLAASQGDKIIASSNAEFGEIRFDYPDSRDGYENSRYLAANVGVLLNEPDKAWYRGIMARTAFVDASPSAYPLGVTYQGRIYWHERGTSFDGAPIPWFIQSSDLYLDENAGMMVNGCWPDVAGQLGSMQLTITTRDKPQGTRRTRAPVTIPPGTAKVDLRVKGRLFTLRFSGNSSPAAARLGKIVFDAVAAGRRT